MSTATARTARTPRGATRPAEPFEILAATLCERFQLPCDEVLRHVNEQFAANPLIRIGV